MKVGQLLQLTGMDGPERGEAKKRGGCAARWPDKRFSPQLAAKLQPPGVAIAGHHARLPTIRATPRLSKISCAPRASFAV
jgi:hypothetical protein